MKLGSMVAMATVSHQEWRSDTGCASSTWCCSTPCRHLVGCVGRGWKVDDGAARACMKGPPWPLHVRVRRQPLQRPPITHTGATGSQFVATTPARHALRAARGPRPA